MLVSAVSIIAPVALNDANNQQGGDSSASISWAPNGKREAVYKFDHWGEVYLKNERWNRSNYSSPNIDISVLGHHGIYSLGSNRTYLNPTGMGASDWLNGSGAYREGSYGEVGIRTDRYPYIFANNPNSAETPGVDAATEQDWIVWTPYRITGVIKNESMGKTGSDAQHPWHAWFVPHLGPSSSSGGYINATFYGTYLTGTEVAVIKAPNQQGRGTHYAQWFYGCSGTFLSGTNDGYFYELQAKIQYSRQAAIAYLGWDGVTDIRTWFSGAQLGVIETAWKKDWQWNGSEPDNAGQPKHDPNATEGVYSTYTNYEWDMNNSGMFNLKLKLDSTNSTANTITIRLYSISWGAETLVMRMMEKCNATGWWLNNSGGPRSPGKNIRGSMIDYHEDLYWNISANPGRANMTFRMVTTYRLTAWEDPSSAIFMGGWMLETFHTDYIGNGQGTQSAKHYWAYLSPFNRYDPDQYNADRTSISQVPGALRYMKNASYWTSPVVRNFSKYECFIYDLNFSHWGMGARDFIGVNPNWVANPSGWGGLADNLAKGNFTKNFYWGKLMLGDYCTPFPIVKAGTAYNNVTQVLNISGGSAAGAGTVGIYMEQYALSGRDYWTATGSAYFYQNGKVWAHGMPFIQLDVVPINDYKVALQPISHMVTVEEKVKVMTSNGTGTNGTQVVLKNAFNSNGAWNGTVVLTTTNGAWGANGSSHTFVPSDNGIWWTTITWTASGTHTITAYDRTNGTTSFTDIQTRVSVDVIEFIPEFSDILIPIVGMMALFLVVKARKKKDKTDQ